MPWRGPRSRQMMESSQRFRQVSERLWLNVIASNVTGGNGFTSYLRFSVDKEIAKTSLGSPLWDAYWNFGVAGVFVCMLTLGLGYGLLFRLADDGPRGTRLQCYY